MAKNLIFGCKRPLLYIYLKIIQHLFSLISEKLFKIHYFKNGIDDDIKIKSCIKNNNNLKIIFENCKKERSLEEIALSCNISKSIASKRLQILESMGAIKKIKLEKKIKFCKK